MSRTNLLNRNKNFLHQMMNNLYLHLILLSLETFLEILFAASEAFNLSIKLGSKK